MKLSFELENYINNINWRFAKTYANTWPHYYILKNNMNDEQLKLFYLFYKHIYTYGHYEKYYFMDIWYYEYNGFIYWWGRRDIPYGEITLINRTEKENSFEYKKKMGIPMPEKPGPG